MSDNNNIGENSELRIRNTQSSEEKEENKFLINNNELTAELIELQNQIDLTPNIGNCNSNDNNNNNNNVNISDCSFDLARRSTGSSFQTTTTTATSITSSDIPYQINHESFSSFDDTTHSFPFDDWLLSDLSNPNLAINTTDGSMAEAITSVISAVNTNTSTNTNLNTNATIENIADTDITIDSNKIPINFQPITISQNSNKINNFNFNFINNNNNNNNNNMKAERHYDVLQNWNAFESSASSTLQTQTQNNETTISSKTSIKNITNNNDVSNNSNNTNNTSNTNNNKNIRFNHYTNIKQKRKIEYNDDKDNDADDDDDDNDNKRNLRKGTGKRQKITSNTKDSKNLNIWNKRLNSNSKPVKSILKKTNHISLSQKAREKQHAETPDLNKSGDPPQELTHSHIDQLLQSSSIRNGYRNGYGHMNDHFNGYTYTKKPQFTFYNNGNVNDISPSTRGNSGFSNISSRTFDTSFSTPDSLKVNRYDTPRDFSDYYEYTANDMLNSHYQQISIIPQQEQQEQEHHQFNNEINDFMPNNFTNKTVLDDFDLESAFDSVLSSSNGKISKQNKILEQVENQHGQEQQQQEQQQQEQQQQQQEFNQNTLFPYNQVNYKDIHNLIYGNDLNGYYPSNMQDFEHTQKIDPIHNMECLPDINTIPTKYPFANSNGVIGNTVANDANGSNFVNKNNVANVNGVINGNGVTNIKYSNIEHVEKSKPPVVLYSERFKKEEKQSNQTKRNIKSSDNSITTLKITIQDEEIENDQQQQQQPKKIGVNTNEKKDTINFDLDESLSKHGLDLDIEKLEYDSNTANLTETQKKNLNFHDVSSSVRKDIFTPIVKLYDVLELEANTDRSIKLGATNELVKYYTENKNSKKKIDEIPEELKPSCYGEESNIGRTTKKTDETVINLKKLVDIVNSKDTPESQYIETIDYDIKVNKPSNPELVSKQMLDILKDDIHNIDLHKKSLKDKQKKSDTNVENTDSSKKTARRKAGEAIEWKPLSPAVVLGYRKDNDTGDKNDDNQYKASQNSCFGVLNFRNLRAWKRSSNK